MESAKRFCGHPVSPLTPDDSIPRHAPRYKSQKNGAGRMIDYFVTQRVGSSNLSRARHCGSPNLRHRAIWVFQFS
jgi:hypothetical protein